MFLAYSLKCQLFPRTNPLRGAEVRESLSHLSHLGAPRGDWGEEMADTSHYLAECEIKIIYYGNIVSIIYTGLLLYSDLQVT